MLEFCRKYIVVGRTGWYTFTDKSWLLQNMSDNFLYRIVSQEESTLKQANVIQCGSKECLTYRPPFKSNVGQDNKQDN